MDRSEIKKGHNYYDPKYDQIVTCYAFIDEYIMVHPPGEPDMQSCYGVKPDELKPAKDKLEE